MLHFLFATADGLFLLAVFVLPPLAFTLSSFRTIKPAHVKINGILAAVFAVPAAISIPMVEPGGGFGGGFGGLMLMLAQPRQAGFARSSGRGTFRRPDRRVVS